jgi:hypothetical protein
MTFESADSVAGERRSRKERGQKKGAADLENRGHVENSIDGLRIFPADARTREAKAG